MNLRSSLPLVLAAGAFVALLPVAPAAATTLPDAPVAAETFDVGTLHVQRYGSGPETLVLIPGLASGTWTWYGTIARETPHATIYALTLPGFDGRAASTDASLFAGFDRDFTALLAARRLQRPIVVGHSLGGTLAIMLAEKHPSAMRAIVAVDGLPIFPLLATAGDDERKAAAARIAAPLAASTHDGLVAYNRQFMSTIGTIDGALAAPVAALQATSDPHAVAAWLTGRSDDRPPARAPRDRRSLCRNHAIRGSAEPGRPDLHARPN